ncbi:hypothetical protein BT93_J1162 [Corymbia citriodora subsp. variegata]|nr:hypothetical protein BT93_J1162 [Corymbia citriodora subsp. variegata]
MPANEQQFWKNPSIYRVPASITDLNPKAYRPQVVSFGPYHHYDPHLRPMEEHKHHALLHFLKRSGKSLERIFDYLKEVVHELEHSYDSLDPMWKNCMGDQFLELMITDGCFMLEIMRTATSKENDYAPNDPIFSTHRLTYIIPYIRRDMLMLENQLPMLVLYRLFNVENDGMRDDVNNLILGFHYFDIDMTVTVRCLHVMDVFLKGWLAKPEKDQPIPKKVGHEPILLSATELNEAGIKFQKSSTCSLEDIYFDKGVLELPLLTVEDNTESMFLNAMAFERLHIGAGNGVTSYVTFMDRIINDEQDVALLHTEGIIQNNLGSDEDVAKLFNSLCTDVTLPSNVRLEAVRGSIDEYRNKSWNKSRAYLNRTYFKNPWTILSLAAAMFLFALTIIQTVYIVLTYY